MRISLNEPIFNKKDYYNLKNCFKSGWISTSGIYINKFEKLISKLTKQKYIFSTNSGTSALHLLLMITKLNKTNEVLVPNITFVASINPVLYCGASPVFIDVDDNYFIDQDKTINFLTQNCILKKNQFFNKKTKKRISHIILVHTFGNALNFEKLYEFCKNKDIIIIEDAAESIGVFFKDGKFKNKHTGTVSDYGALSFNGNKIITSGGGGALLLASKNKLKNANYLASQAKKDNVFFKHNDLGFNYKLTNIHASIGYSQIQNIKKIITQRKKIYDFYKKHLNKIKDLNVFEIPNEKETNYWLMILQISGSIKKAKIKRNKILNLFKKNGVESRSVWQPNHMNLHLRKFQKYEVKKSLDLYCRSVCLPSSHNLSMNSLNKIVRILKRS